MAALTPILENPGSDAANLLDHWLTAIAETPREQLAGVILDNRSNSGGYQDDLDYLVGPYIHEKTEVFKTRYKEGPGRLEHSVWTPYYLFPQANTIATSPLRISPTSFFATSTLKAWARQKR